ncbi:MAG: hypothetical protein K2K15_02940 [Anaeroplasmataceae bacterium]|nr:hypothetical protein [Anaeroplasmataceae bacterium]
MKKIYYYENPLTDDFAELKRDPIPIDSKYKYERGILWKFLSFILYRLIMTPIAYFYMKLKYRLKIKNK